MALVIFVSCVYKCQKNAPLRIESFPYKDSVNYILAGVNDTRQHNPMQGNVSIVNFYWMPCLGTIKHSENLKIVNFHD